MNKTIDLNKVGFFFIVITGITAFITGMAYNQFCTDKIEMRENHLIAISQTLIPPEGAMKTSEYIFDKLFYRDYSMYYTYEKKASVGIEHYAKELVELGYEIKKGKGNQLEARKNGILIEIDCRRKELSVHIMFDDIFNKLSI